MKTTEINIPVSSVTLKGDLAIPENAGGLVVFSHGSGSSRLSPRNIQVAELIQQHGMGTLLFDLLTEKEDQIYETRFNIDLLVQRLIQATKWLGRSCQLKIANRLFWCQHRSRGGIESGGTFWTEHQSSGVTRRTA